jgi:hypothetical protein
MKLYLAVVTDITMESTSEDVLGVYETKEEAAKALGEHWNFKRAQNIGDGKWRYIYDGEYSVYFEIEETALGRPRGSWANS